MWDIAIKSNDRSALREAQYCFCIRTKFLTRCRISVFLITFAHSQSAFLYARRQHMECSNKSIVLDRSIVLLRTKVTFSVESWPYIETNSYCVLAPFSIHSSQIGDCPFGALKYCLITSLLRGSVDLIDARFDSISVRCHPHRLEIYAARWLRNGCQKWYAGFD